MGQATTKMCVLYTYHGDTITHMAMHQHVSAITFITFLSPLTVCSVHTAQPPPRSNIISSKPNLYFVPNSLLPLYYVLLLLHLSRVDKALTPASRAVIWTLAMLFSWIECQQYCPNLLFLWQFLFFTLSRFSLWLKYLIVIFIPSLSGPLSPPSHISAFIRCPCKHQLKLEKHPACFCLLKPNPVSRLFWKSECFAWEGEGVFLPPKAGFSTELTHNSKP